ncbi:ImmA/IrrE family metallo-endopeptidase, partial [Vibrio parahaemolyticus]
EREANSFAASMLMPRDTLKNYHTITQDLSELASKFQVSKAAMQYRLEDLGLPFNL